MSDCCASGSCSSSPPKRLACPGCQRPCAEVNAHTLRHQLASPWQHPLKAQRYFFCDEPLCAVVYFSDNGETYTTGDLREAIGQKQTGAEKTLCYCFGVTLGDYQADPAVKDYVTAQTKAGECACDTRNPSGKCCLKDFPK